jgi:hypothetical protein
MGREEGTERAVDSEACVLWTVSTVKWNRLEIKL